MVLKEEQGGRVKRLRNVLDRNYNVKEDSVLSQKPHDFLFEHKLEKVTF